MRDGELSPSTLRRPQAPGTAAPRNRVALSVAICLSVLAAPLLMLKAGSSAAAAHASVRTVAHRSAASDSATSSTGSGYGVPDGILTAADLADAAADGVTATGATGASSPAAGGPDSSPGGTSGPAQAHIAAVSPASPVTAPQSTSPTSPPTTAAPTTTTRPPATTTTRPPTTTTRPPAASQSSSNSETGPASWYDAPAGTCAHPSLPFGTVVTVTNLANGATTTCKVEDRGPYQGGRIIDLSEATFSQIASTSDGVIQVRISW